MALLADAEKNRYLDRLAEALTALLRVTTPPFGIFGETGRFFITKTVVMRLLSLPLPWHAPLLLLLLLALLLAVVLLLWLWLLVYAPRPPHHTKKKKRRAKRKATKGQLQQLPPMAAAAGMMGVALVVANAK